MAVIAGIPIDGPVASRVMQKLLSGVVTINGAPAARQIMAYLVRSPETLWKTVSSDIDGTWELLVNIGLGDEARVLCVGEDGENSFIYEHIT